MEQYTNTTYHSGPMGGTAKMKNNPEFKLSKRVVIISVLLILLLIVISGGLVVTYPNEYTLVKQFGKVVRVVDEPGLSFKVPFIQTSSTLPNQVLLYDLAPTDVITKDKKSMVADSYVLWRIEDPLLFVQQMQSSVPTAETTIYGKVFNAMKNVISSHDQTEVISSREGGLAKEMEESIGDSLQIYGIELINVVVKRLDLPDDNKAAVYERMISERNNIAAKYAAEGEMEAAMIKTATDTEVLVMVSEAEAQAQQLIAEGEAEYMNILSQAYNDEDKADFYTFVLSLDAAKNSLTGDNKTLILDKDSPIAQIFSTVE